MSATVRDPYEALGVSKDASDDEIRRAYRKLARTHHPDVSKEAGAEERFKEIGEAYALLSDPERRAEWDQFGAAGPPPPGAGPYGAGPPYGDTGGWTVRTDDPGAYEDLFSQLFGQRAPGGAGGVPNMRGGDVEAMLDVTLEESAKGGSRRLTLPDGDTVEVTIPKGVIDGQRIRMAGRGGEGLGDAPRGDLFLEVRLRPHSRFRVEGRDLHTTLRIAPWEAALGARVELSTLTGTTRVSVSAGTSSGKRLRLRGQGLPNPKGEPGDLYATIEITMPTGEPSDREKELWEELSGASNFNPRRSG